MTNELWFARNLQIFTISRLHLLPDVMFLPSNRDHISRKRILLFQIYHFLLSLNVPQLFQILVYKQGICLLGCFFYLHIMTFTNFRDSCVFVCVVTFDIRVDLTFKMMERKCKKSIREWQNIRNVTNEESSNFTLLTFLSCHTFLF